MTVETLIALACLTEREREAFIDKNLCGVSFYRQARRDGLADVTVRHAHNRAVVKLAAALTAAGRAA